MQTVSGRRRRRALRFAVVVLGTAVISAATKGPDAGGYTASDGVVYSMVDISGSGGGISVLAGVDDGAVPLVVPFPFRFYGRSYTIVCASTNGALYFVESAGECGGLEDFGNADLTSAPTVRDLPAVLPLWSDLTFDAPGAGAVFYQTVGAPGDRRFIVQWKDAYPQGSPNPVTFQVLLSEATGAVLFQYQTVALGAGNPASQGRQATIGIRNTQGVTTQQQIAWSFQAPVLGDATALAFSQAISRVLGDVDGDGEVTCADATIVRNALGTRSGQPGFDARADLNSDGRITGLDLSTIMKLKPNVVAECAQSPR
jgi:hypothetical protein